MELKWLQDVLALSECESLTAAAERRRVTQPAFSRRLRAFESWLGVEVVDRSRKVSRITPAVAAHIESVEALVRGFYRLRNDVRAAERSRNQLVFVAQHTLTMTYLPSLISRLQSIMELTTIRLRAANMDDCYTLLLRHEADILIGYRTRGVDLPLPAAELDCLWLSGDELVPMVAPALHARVTREAARTRSPHRHRIPVRGVSRRRVPPEHRARSRSTPDRARGLRDRPCSRRDGADPRGARDRLVAEESRRDACRRRTLVPLPAELGVVPLDIVAMRRGASRDARVDAAWGALGEAAEERRSAAPAVGG